MRKFPWDCNDCPMLKTYDMSIDDLTHICLWSKKQIDDCDRYKSEECPMEKHDIELLDKFVARLEDYFVIPHDVYVIEKMANELKAEVS